MSNRICPNCQYSLNHSNHFFCSNCGFALPKDLINKDVNFKVRTTRYVVEDASLRKYYGRYLEYVSQFITGVSKKPLVELLLLLNLLAICFVVYEFLYPKFSTYMGFQNLTVARVPNPAIPPEVLKADEGVLLLGVTEGSIDIDEFASLYPNDIGIFGVIPNSNFQDLVFIPSLQSEFLNSVKELSKPVSFGLRKEDGNYFWVFVIKKNSANSLEELFVKDFEFLEYFETEKYFLISNSEAMLEDSKSAMEKKSLSLRNEASYALKVPTPAKTSKGILFLFSDEIREYFVELNSQPILSSIFKQKVGELVNSSYNEFIIK